MVGSRRKAVMEPFQRKQLCYGSWSKHRCLEVQVAGGVEQSHGGVLQRVCLGGRLVDAGCRVRQQIPAGNELWERHCSLACVSPAVLASWLPWCGMEFWLGAGNLWNRKKAINLAKVMVGCFYQSEESRSDFPCVSEQSHFYSQL